MKPRVYLAGPINGCSDQQAHGWRESFKDLYCGPTLDPMRRDYRGKERENYREIVEFDKRDIDLADAILVYALPVRSNDSGVYSHLSVGTSMEIIYAFMTNTPVVLWCEDGVSMSPWLRYHSTVIVHSERDAMSAVLRVPVRSVFG